MFSVGEALIAPESLNLLEKRLDKINTPTLLLWGKEDKVRVVLQKFLKMALRFNSDFSDYFLLWRLYICGNIFVLPQAKNCDHFPPIHKKLHLGLIIRIMVYTFPHSSLSLFVTNVEYFTFSFHPLPTPCVVIFNYCFFLFTDNWSEMRGNHREESTNATATDCDARRSWSRYFSWYPWKISANYLRLFKLFLNFNLMGEDECFYYFYIVKTNAIPVLHFETFNWLSFLHFSYFPGKVGCHLKEITDLFVQNLILKGSCVFETGTINKWEIWILSYKCIFNWRTKFSCFHFVVNSSLPEHLWRSIFLHKTIKLYNNWHFFVDLVIRR